MKTFGRFWDAWSERCDAHELLRPDEHARTGEYQQTQMLV